MGTTARCTLTMLYFLDSHEGLMGCGGGAAVLTTPTSPRTPCAVPAGGVLRLSRHSRRRHPRRRRRNRRPRRPCRRRCPDRRPRRRRHRPLHCQLCRHQPRRRQPRRRHLHHLRPLPHQKTEQTRGGCYGSPCGLPSACFSSLLSSCSCCATAATPACRETKPTSASRETVPTWTCRCFLTRYK